MPQISRVERKIRFDPVNNSWAAYVSIRVPMGGREVDSDVFATKHGAIDWIWSQDLRRHASRPTRKGRQDASTWNRKT